MALNMYMSITLYMAYNAIICTISFGLLESFKITLLEDFILKIFKFKVTEKSKIKPFSATWAYIISPSKSLNKVFLDRPNRIVQMNVLHAIYSYIVL